MVHLIEMHMHVGTGLKIPTPGLIRHPRSVKIEAPEVWPTFEDGQARIPNLHINQVQKPQFRQGHHGRADCLALKVLAAGEGASKGQVRRFKREISTASRLRHPNIVTVFDVGVHDGAHFFTMEYIEGPSLLDLVGRIPMKRAIDIAIEVADALDHAHEGGVLHRDLKPANIILENGKTPKVVDFGLAKDTTEDALTTRSGMAIGTPAYMSPEAVQGRIRAITKRSDVYSLGVILYELLTARQPFRGNTRMEVMMKVVEEEPTPPTAVNSRIPPDLEAICVKAMAKRKRERYATAGALRDDLMRFRGGKPVLARPRSIASRLQTSLSRKGKALWMGFIGVVALMSLGLGFAVPVAPDVESSDEVKNAKKVYRRATQFKASGARPARPRPGDTPEKPVPKPPPDDDAKEEETAYAAVRQTVSAARKVDEKIRLLEAFLAKYPDGRFAFEVATRIKDLKEKAAAPKRHPLKVLRDEYIQQVDFAKLKPPKGVTAVRPRRPSDPDSVREAKGLFMNTKDNSALVLVPGGAYPVGSVNGRRSETPAHLVRLSPSSSPRAKSPMPSTPSSSTSSARTRPNAAR